jgi:hypothetical protein
VKAYGEAEVYLHVFLTSAIDGRVIIFTPNSFFLQIKIVWLEGGGAGRSLDEPRAGLRAV